MSAVASHFVPMDAAPGRQVGSYVLERRLGLGGMGEVWLGRHVDSGGLGAVKLAKRDGRDPSRRRAFVVREGRAVTRLRHPHIVGIFEVGEDYVVYQYVEGQDLRRRLQSPLDPAGAVRITRQIASALAHAHAHGVIHRDVKPSNILLDTQRNAFLADFGLALVGGEQAADGTARAGTPDFMAPEQKRGERIGAAADQYALGRTLLEMLIGTTPPADPPAALALLPAGLPDAIGELAARATALTPGERFPDMTELEAALAALDLSAFAPPVRLAPEVRRSQAFTWTRGAERTVALAPDLQRSDFRLSRLESAGLLARGRELRERHELADLGWSMYGCSTRLGPLAEPAAAARAGEVIVLLHGLWATRSSWKDIAPAICRDQARALVIAIDVWGGGESRYREPRQRPTRLSDATDTVRELLALLGLGELPTVLVGHSMSGASVIDLGDEAAGPRTSRIAINPVFPYFASEYRYQLKVSRLALRGMAYFPGLYRQAVKRIVHGPSVAMQIAEPIRRDSEREAIALGPLHTRGLCEALLAAKPPTDKRHERLHVLMGLNDPLTDDRVRDEALARLRLPLSQSVCLATGGHFPHIESESNHEWTARNHAEIVHAITHVLSMTLVSPDSEGTSRSHDE